MFKKLLNESKNERGVTDKDQLDCPVFCSILSISLLFHLSLLIQDKRRGRDTIHKHTRLPFEGKCFLLYSTIIYILVQELKQWIDLECRTQFPVIVFIAKVFGTQWSVNDSLVCVTLLTSWWIPYKMALVISISIIVKNGWEFGVTLTVHALWLHNLLCGTCSYTIVLLWLSLRMTMGNAKQKNCLENRSKHALILSLHFYI